jgi:hypothetical protein
MLDLASRVCLNYLSLSAPTLSAGDRLQLPVFEQKHAFATLFLSSFQLNVILCDQHSAVGPTNKHCDVLMSVSCLRRRVTAGKNFQAGKITP